LYAAGLLAVGPTKQRVLQASSELLSMGRDGGVLPGATDNADSSFSSDVARKELGGFHHPTPFKIKEADGR